MTGTIGSNADRASGLAAAAAVASGGFQSVQVFTSNGTWNRPTGITKIMIKCKGGGGGGGGGYTDSHSGTGGAEGGTAVEFLDVSSTASASITVGAGGAAGAAGNNGGSGQTDGGTGGTTSFASICSATGGHGGFIFGQQYSSNDDIGRPALGGLGANGNLNIRGSSSTPTNRITGHFTGSGAGTGSGKGVTGASTAGTDAIANSGGGGAGGTYGNGGNSGAGGVGGSGYVIVEEYK